MPKSINELDEANRRIANQRKTIRRLTHAIQYPLDARQLAVEMDSLTARISELEVELGEVEETLMKRLGEILFRLDGIEKSRPKALDFQNTVCDNR